jgi:hypothetical protein
MSVKNSKSFAEVVSDISSDTIGLNTKKGYFVFPKGRKINGVVLTETASSENYPTILDAYTRTQQFRGKKEDEVIKMFMKMMSENEDLAIRFFLYLRDIRNGAGERDASRHILASLSAHPNIESIINRIPELGRFDDLLIEWKSEKAMRFAVARFCKGFETEGEKGLAFKWAPRRGIWEYRLRKEMGMTAKDYRHFVVGGTKVVEQKMCAGQWTDINYSGVPSQAHRIYRKAFGRHDPNGYDSYVGLLASGDKSVKINAGAIEPHEFARAASNIKGDTYVKSLDAQFLSIPYDMSGLSVFPIVDVSPSMTGATAATNLTCKQAAMSIGLYFSLNQKNDLRGYLMSFSEKPKLLNYSSHSGFTSMISDLQHQDWGRYTDLTASMKMLFKKASSKGVSNDDLPDVLLILSDMNFNGSGSLNGNTIQSNEIKKIAKKHGFTKIPTIVFWNLARQASGHAPKVVAADENGVIMISGFSTKIMKSLGKIIAGNEIVSTDTAMLEVLLSERYNYL